MVLPVGRQPNEHSTFGVVEIPQHKLLLCTLAKVGSTQWRRMVRFQPPMCSFNLTLSNSPH